MRGYKHVKKSAHTMYHDSLRNNILLLPFDITKFKLIHVRCSIKTNNMVITIIQAIVTVQSNSMFQAQFQGAKMIL